MTDNTIASTPIGTGDTFAAKDIAGVKYPRNILTTPSGTDITPLSEGGAVSVSNFPATQAVTGTFYPATQPVSGTITVGNASLPVTGTFWQATQPISAGSLPLPTGAATDATLSALAADITASGTITIQNSVPTGTATAGSAVEISCVGKSLLTVQTVGTWTGTLVLQVTVDGANWIQITNSCFMAVSGTSSATIGTGSQVVVSANVAGWTKARISASAAVTGSVVVTLRASAGVNNVILGVGASAAIGALSATTALVGDAGIQYRATATGGATVAKILTAATTNATCPKASAGRLLGWTLQNTTASVKVVHIHNLAVAPTVGTSVPMFSIVIPANGSKETVIEGGMAMTTGIAYSITTLIADLDNTATAVGDVIGALFYA